jgi:hypothetical protein
MDNLKKLYFTIILAFYNCYVIAAPTDHGREDISNNSFGLDDLLGYVLLFVICIVGIAMFLKNMFSDDSQNNTIQSKGNNPNKRIISEMNPIYNHTELCYKCYGKGYIRGKDITNCSTCGGKGHIESEKAYSLYKKYKERKRPRADEDRRFTMYKAGLIYKEYLKELEKCPNCPDCSKYQDRSDVFIDNDGRKYLKIKCDQCKGTGWTTRKLI